MLFYITNILTHIHYKLSGIDEEKWNTCTCRKPKTFGKQAEKLHYNNLGFVWSRTDPKYAVRSIVVDQSIFKTLMKYDPYSMKTKVK